MRFWVGILLLIVVSGSAFGQATGEVESIGFDGYYRPNCWTPMRLRLRSKISTPGTYKLQVIQEDMDQDPVQYTRPFTLNAAVEGFEERAWVYFLPQPKGLEANPGGADLQKILRVFLCKEDGTQLEQIKIPPNTRMVDLDSLSPHRRGTRLVLGVANQGSQPILREAYENAVGVSEDMLFSRMTPKELPASVRALEAVDVIVWFNSDPADLSSESATAIEEFVKDGGHLVICQNQNWQLMAQGPLAHLLPVELTGVETEVGATSLLKLSGLPPYKERPGFYSGYYTSGAARNERDIVVHPWSDMEKRATPIARAIPKPKAMVRMFSASDPRSPYLARWLHGAGTVTWVAQDLGDPEVQSTSRGTLNLRNLGWEKIWDTVFGWQQSTQNETTKKLLMRSARESRDFNQVSAYTDLSRAQLGGMEHAGRGAALVALALLFFVGYWVVAGPGTYFALHAKKKSHYSWMAYALCALAATGLTVLVVKLVLRGPAQIQHVTVIRAGSDREALITSNLGLYIPRDGNQTIELKNAAGRRTSYVAPYPLHPRHMEGSASFTAPKRYEVPVRETNSPEGLSIDVPYRSTLKKFTVKWVGEIKGGIDGVARIDKGLKGQLVNSTGADLHDLYLVYLSDYDPHLSAGMADDRVLHIPSTSAGPAWPAGSTLDLGALRTRFFDHSKPRPAQIDADEGWLNTNFMFAWSGEFKNRYDDATPGSAYRAAFLMSVYDRILPVRQLEKDAFDGRFELMRRAGRRMNASGVINAGQLLVVARGQPEAPLPFPLEVEGDRIPGSGIIYYQFAVPLERPVHAPPSTRPSTRPVQPATDEKPLAEQPSP